MNLKYYWHKLYYLYLKKDYSAFARKIGVNIGNGCELLDSPSQIFGGSEPYLIKIGNNVRITHGVRFVNHDGGVWVLRHLLKDMYSDISNIDLFGRIIIGSNVHIGMNSTIMPGVEIGDNCIIGCGTIVTKNIPNNSVAVGVPAIVIENIEEYYRKHAPDFDYTKQLTKNEKKSYLLKKYNLV